MNKKLVGILSVVFILGICIWGFYTAQSFKAASSLATPSEPLPSFNIVHADRGRLAFDTEQLGDASDLTVIAKVVPGKENKLIESYDGAFILHGYTLTNLEIVSVLKGSIDTDTITITEEYFELPGETGAELWTQEDYLPANEGETYLFFLKKYDDNSFPDMYFPIDLQYGKYVVYPQVPMSNDTPDLTALEVRGDVETSDYPTWYAEVYHTYISAYLDSVGVDSGTPVE